LQIIPNPLSAKSQNHTFSVSAELIHPIGEYILKLSGLEEGERIAFFSTSGKEKISHPIECPLSEFSMGYSPATLDQDGGIAKASFKRLKNGDTVSLQVMWGSKLMDCYIQFQEDAGIIKKSEARYLRKALKKQLKIN
jgi:hypothetical protein